MGPTKKRILGIQSHRSIAEQTLSGLTTPNGEDKKLNRDQDNTFANGLNQKFSDFMKNRKTKNLIQKIKKQRGRNNPISYQEGFKLKEQWQLKDKLNYTLHYNYLFPQKLIFKIFNAIMLFLFIFQIWLLSVFRLFQYQDSLWVFCYSLTVNLLDIVLKLFFIYWFLSDDKIKNQHKKMEIMEYVQQFIGNLFASLYSILGIAKVISDIDKDIFLLMDFACIIFVYMRCEEIYRNFKILIVCSKYKPYMKIYDLMSNLFLLTHLFGVVIYGVSRFQPSQSYLTIIESKGHMSWIDRYIYSIYFSSTTMLTVGYGDLLPSNIQQIAVVLIMQLFGIVMIGYINGQVGDVLCTLRKQRESLQDDLTNTQKLSKSFGLNHQTTQKIRQYLINNRKLDEELNIQDQNKLLSKISDQLRNQANNINNINIIKQSLLFIYNFSKKTQIEVSYKLNKIIFSPNQTLPQIMGKEKIYLISKGQIAIFLAKKNKKGIAGRKILRTLCKKTNHDFHQNSFGHTALVLGRPTQLKAFSKDFAICHTIERHDLLDALGMDSNDLERFHEMRANYETCKNPQKQECSQFFSIREHYAPNPEFVIKRYLKEKCTTKRKQWIRNRQKSRKIIEDFEQEEEMGMYDDVSINSEVSSQMTVIDPSNIREEEILTKKQRQNKYQSVGSIKLSILNIRGRNYSSKYMNKKYQQKRQELVRKFNSRELQEPFEVMKEYGIFYKHANITNVLKKCMLSNPLLQVFTPVLEILPSFYNERSITSKFESQFFWQRRRVQTQSF